jgi:hypothetical protein
VGCGDGGGKGGIDHDGGGGLGGTVKLDGGGGAGLGGTVKLDDGGGSGLGGTVKLDGGGGAGGAAIEAGAPDVSLAVDVNVTSDATLAPDAAVCHQLATAAQAQFGSYLDSTSSLACQVDSDCSDLSLKSWNCFAACGQLVRTADITTLTAATASVCDEYFGAGCPAITPPCPFPHAFCDHDTCAYGFGPGGPSGATDAAVDAGASEIPIDGGNTSEVKSSALEDSSTIADGGACTWPAGFTSTGDSSAVGCWAHAISGVIDAGLLSCGSSEYTLHCVGDIQQFDSGCQMRTMPAPDFSLGCRLLPLPTPSNQSYYCCTCGEGQTSLADASVSMSSGCP